MQYRRRDSMARLYDLSPRTVDNLVKEMAETQRYPEDFCLMDYGYVLIEEDAFRDYLRWRKVLKSAGAKKVPDYQRKETPEDVFILGGKYVERMVANVKRR